MVNERDRDRHTALGAAALAFFAIHTWELARRGEVHDALWNCNVANLLIGVGLLVRVPWLVASGVAWLSLGVPYWILYLCRGGEFIPTSVLTHVGGLVIGCIGVARVGWPSAAWWRALAALVVLGRLTRLVTPEVANVNMSYRPWDGWDFCPSYAVYFAVVVIFHAAVFFGLERLARALEARGRAT
jgi:hypothetical protein